MNRKPTEPTIYRLIAVEKSFPHPEMGRLKVLRGISIDILPGITAIRGESGGGKSTLLHILAGLDTPTSGAVSLNGISIDYRNRRSVLSLRRRVSLIFQENNLISHLTVLENVAFPRICRRANRADVIAEAGRVLSHLGLGQHLHCKPGTLSGGQKQRVGIARAFINSAEVILADEPTGNLDPESALTIMEALRALAEANSVPVVLVTHNAELAEQFCDHQLVLRNGVLLDSAAELRDLDPSLSASGSENASPAEDIERANGGKPDDCHAPGGRDHDAQQSFLATSSAFNHPNQTEKDDYRFMV